MQLIVVFKTQDTDEPNGDVIAQMMEQADPNGFVGMFVDLTCPEQNYRVAAWEFDMAKGEPKSFDVNVIVEREVT